MIQAYWHRSKNVGDTLTPFIVEFFTGHRVEYAERASRGKLLAVGSIMSALRNGDTVWGTGVMYESATFPNKELCKFLAFRGKLSEKIFNKKVGVYGDPALLLPLMYNPVVTKKYKIGYVPHHVDRDIALADPLIASQIKSGEALFIDVFQNWKTVVDQLKTCETVISSSLHGIVMAEAYGIPAEWVEYSNGVLGAGFKFRDYLTGTGREPRIPSKFPQIENLDKIQHSLIASLQAHYG